MARFQDQIVDEHLHAIAGALIWVYTVSANPGTLATLTDDASNAIVQPVVSDANGIFYYNATDGVYENQIHYGGQLRYVQQVLVGQAIGTWADGNKGDITVSGGGTNWQVNAGAIGTNDLAAGAVTLAKQANVNSGTLFYRKTAGAGAPETQTLATLATDLGVSGVNTGDQTITLTGDVTGSGTGSFVTAIGAGKVTLAQMANMATASLIYRKTAGSGAPEVNSLATLKTDLGLTGTNSGDQTITLTGDVTGSGTGSFAASIAANAVTTAKIADANVTLAKLANLAAGTVIGSVAGGVPAALTPTQQTALLNQFTTALQGLAPASGGGTVNYLRADGTWAAPPGAGAATWGTITGTLSAQTDLQTALNGKASTAVVTSGAAGLAPASGGGTTNFLRADGTWQAPPGGTLFTSVANGIVPASGGGTSNFLRADGTWAAAGGGSGSTSDSAYGVGWDGTTTVSPSQNAVYDKIQTMPTLPGTNVFTGQQQYNEAGAALIVNAPTSNDARLEFQQNASSVGSFGVNSTASGINISSQFGKTFTVNIGGTDRTVWSAGNLTHTGEIDLVQTSGPTYFKFQSPAGTDKLAIAMGSDLSTLYLEANSQIAFQCGWPSAAATVATLDASAGLNIFQGGLYMNSVGLVDLSRNVHANTLDTQGAITVNGAVITQGANAGVNFAARATGNNFVAYADAGAFTLYSNGAVRWTCTDTGNVVATGTIGASNLSGSNTGDESSATILTKLSGASGGGTVNFLRADGTWAAPTASVTTTSINTVGGNMFVGKNTAGAGTCVEMTAAQAKTLLALAPADLTTAAAQVALARGASAGAVQEIALAANTFLGRGASGSVVACTLGTTLAFTAAALGVVSVPNAATFNNGGAGAASGTTFDGSAARTVSWNTIGAAPDNPRFQSVASAATVTPTFSNDIVDITAQAVALTLANPTGTAVDGWGMMIRIKDNGTARAISYGTQYAGVGVVLPTTTVAGKYLILGMVFCNAATKWHVTSVAQE